MGKQQEEAVTLLTKKVVNSLVIYGPTVAIGAARNALVVMAVSAEIPYEKMAEMLRDLWAAKQQRLDDYESLMALLKQTTTVPQG